VQNRGSRGLIGIHIWYPDLLGAGLRMFLMVATGFLYGGFLQLGYALQQRIRSPWRILVLPVVWTALEWVRFVLPVTREWWIEVLAKSQWLSPAPLQLLSLTGFAGLSFIIMLSNSALAGLLVTWLEDRKPNKAGVAAILIPVAVTVWGSFIVLHTDHNRPVRAAAKVSAGTGMSQVITPYGEMAVKSEMNHRGFISGETSVYTGLRTLYNRFGDWFAMTNAAALLLLLGFQARRKGTK
jgi:apolipoprotein N-acyltransferase